jgi:hypothetical protein
MATRFSVSLAHAGCNHTGFVVWEERERPEARGVGSPVMVGLPRGFVSLNTEDGVIEIVCAGCRQTVASAARSGPPCGDAGVEAGVAALDSVVGEATSDVAGPDVAVLDVAVVDVAVPDVATSPPAAGEVSADARTDDKVRADIEALFAEAEDVAPIRGDAIPQHLLHKLRHLSDRMRQRRE